MYADKLISLGRSLADCKAKIVYALNIHVAVSVDGLQVSVTDMQSQMKVILDNVVKSKSPDELEWDKELAALGGWEKCRSDPLMRDQLFKLFQAKFRNTSDSPITPDRRTRTGKGKRRRGLNALQDLALDSSMDALIQDNMSSYAQKLQHEMRHTTRALDSWGAKIVTRMDAGPHERIKHAVCHLHLLPVSLYLSASTLVKL